MSLKLFWMKNLNYKSQTPNAAQEQITTQVEERVATTDLERQIVYACTKSSNKVLDDSDPVCLDCPSAGIPIVNRDMEVFAFVISVWS